MAISHSITSRRSILAGLAGLTAAPVMALPAAALDFPDAGKIPDPVFAAIEAERAAYAAWDAHSPIHTKAEEEWFAAEKRVPAHILIYGQYKAETEADIDRIISAKEDGWSPEEMRMSKTLRKMQRKRLREALAKHDEALRQCGIEAAEDKDAELMHEWCEAENAVLATIPTTREGAVALAQFARKWIEAGNNQEKLLLPTFAALEAFLAEREAAHV